MSTLGVLTNLALLAMAATACGGPQPAATGPVPGVPDRHCLASDGGALARETRATSCRGGADAGSRTEDPVGTRFNAEADDDDCKYRVAFTSTQVQQGEVWFTVKATSKVDGTPVTGAGARADAFLSEVHPAPNTPASTSESTPGTYVLGPVNFDAPGRWTVRFHLFSGCSEALEDSPHAHAAFWLDVP